MRVLEAVDKAKKSIIIGMEDCIFCKIASGDIPCDIVLRDDAFLAFRDINPQAPQHVLVIPCEHVDSLAYIDELQACDGQALLSFIAKVAHELGLSTSGYRVITNVGPDSGQAVAHLHFHILGGERLGTMR